MCCRPRLSPGEGRERCEGILPHEAMRASGVSTWIMAHGGG